MDYDAFFSFSFSVLLSELNKSKLEEAEQILQYIHYIIISHIKLTIKYISNFKQTKYFGTSVLLLVF